MMTPDVSRRTIPYDLAFRYELAGEPEKVHRKVATISIEATFVAVSVGYGLVPVVPALTFGPARPAGPVRTPIATLTLGSLLTGLTTALKDQAPAGEVGARVASVFTNGLKLNPAFAVSALGNVSRKLLDPNILDNLFQPVAAPPERVQFLYALFDDATGREFQSEPILNIAGLGAADGDRPFRYFAQPIVFRPRSTIRLEITEKSEFEGELHVSLQGYKSLGGSGSPTGRAIRRAAGLAGASQR